MPPGFPSRQVKTSRDYALQSNKSTLCWVHSRRRVKFVPAHRAHPRSFGSLGAARRLRTRYYGLRQPSGWRLIEPPLTLSPRLAAAFRSCALPHHTSKASGFAAVTFSALPAWLDAGGSLNQRWCSARRRRRFPSFMRTRSTYTVTRRIYLARISLKLRCSKVRL